MTRDEMIELIARAAFGDGLSRRQFSELGDDAQDAYRYSADRVLTALEAAGLRIVPVDAIKEAKAALNPFAYCVYNDNGDMTVSGPLYPWSDAYKAAYFAWKRMTNLLEEE